MRVAVLEDGSERFTQRLVVLRSSLADRLKYIAGELDRKPHFYYIWFALLYFPLVCVAAIRKFFWFDEIFTVYVSALPNFGDIWRALAKGTEANPPLNYWLTRAACELMGTNHLSIRTTAILGFLVMSLCVFRFVARRCPAPFAAAAMVLPLLTSAYYYAYEARPYGLVLGFAGSAAVCWQSAGERKNFVPVAGLGLSIAASVSSHYYGVFILFPLLCGEVVRSVRRREMDLLIWAAFAGGLLPLLFFAPLILSANANVFASPFHAERFWARPTFPALIENYQWLVYPAIPALLLGLLLAMLARAGDKSGRSDLRPAELIPPEEVAVGIAFLALPIVVVLFTKLLTGYYVNRYSLPAVVGLAVLFGFAAARRLRNPATGILIAILLTGGFVVEQIRGALVSKEDVRAGVGTYEFLDSGGRGLSVAVANPLVFATLSYYAPPQLASRLIYLSDPQIAVTYPDFIPELALRSLRMWAPVKVVDYRKYLSTHSRFLVYTTSLPRLEWLIPELLKAGYSVELKAQSGQESLFEVRGGSTYESDRGHTNVQ